MLDQMMVGVPWKSQRVEPQRIDDGQLQQPQIGFGSG
jgi:hypothetical protein